MGVPINNVTRRVVYAASGTGPYNFTFEILAAADVAVYKDDALLTLTTDYTVTINSNGTGYVTLVASPTGATQIAIVGNRTIQRTTDFTTGGDFFANTVNDELDQQTIFSQQNAEGLGRALQAPQTDPTTINMTLPRASLRAGKNLAFDSNGNPTLGDTLGTNRGNWAASVLYYVRDIVKDTSNNNIWQCITQHTSSGSQPINTNTDSAKWSLLVDAASASTSATNAAASASAAATSASNASTSATNAASSASTASTQASNASTSASNASGSASTASTAATNAGNSATAAASSASGASTSATNAASSASSASTSASNASSSASSASTSASNASTSATNAANSASAASTSATNASNSATAANTSASNASTSATNASNSATAAATSETNAATSAAAAAAALDNFDDRYLGAKSSNPTVDNDGNALLTGALYYRTTTPVGMKVYDGTQWLEASAAQQSLMVTYEFVATAGQTTFSGLDANGATLSYVANSISVSLNGVTLRPGDDYTATNGTSIVLNVAAALNDELMVIAFAVFNVANAVAKTGDTMTGSLLLPAGTVSAPALTTSADTNTGMFFPAADTIAFAEGGAEVARFDSSGNFGIGVTPSYRLEVKGPSATAGQLSIHDGTGDTTVSGVTAASLLFQARDSSVRTIAEIDAVNTTTNGTGGAMVFQTRISDTLAERMRIDSSGNVGIGTSSPAQKFTLQSSGNTYLLIEDTLANGYNAATLYKNTDRQFRVGCLGGIGGFTNGALIVYDETAATYRMVINSTGEVIVGGTTDQGAYNLQCNGTGVWGAGAYVNGSDERIKEDIAPIQSGLDVVEKLNPVTYRYKESWTKDQSVQTGFIAQELLTALEGEVYVDGVVQQGGSEGYYSVAYQNIIPILTKAIQEQQAMIDTMKQEIAELKGAA